MKCNDRPSSALKQLSRREDSLSSHDLPSQLFQGFWAARAATTSALPGKPGLLRMMPRSTATMPCGPSGLVSWLCALVTG